MKILVVDIETTGFVIKWDIITEIAIALVDTDTGKIELVFDNVVKHWKWNPKKHKYGWCFKNTSLTVEDVENAETIKHYYNEIQTLFDTYPMTAYNKSFDIRFLKANGFKVNDIKCLMKTAKEYSEYKTKTGAKKTPSVEEIYNQFFMKGKKGVYVEQHRAGADVMDEAKILLHMVKLKKEKQLVTE